MTLFLKQTLARHKLHEILATRPSAVNHLALYLEKKRLIADLVDLLTASGRYEEAALVAYKQALAVTNVDDKTRKIKAALQNNFHRHPDANHLIGKATMSLFSL